MTNPGPALCVLTWQAVRTLALVVAVLATVGCAATPGGSGQIGTRTDMVTDSDETELRKRARIRVELAVSYFEEGQTTIALDEIKQALVTDPNYTEAFNLRGLIYMRLNDTRQAEDSFRRALLLRPGDPNVLHNYGWLVCQQARYAEATQMFSQALADPQYGERPKTLMTLGLCQIRAGQSADAEASLTRSYELDAGNPITGYNLASMMYQRSEFGRAQFYVRRINNSALANAESLWLGIKVERRLNNADATEQLATQLRKRFGQSREAGLLDRGAFNE